MYMNFLLVSILLIITFILGIIYSLNKDQFIQYSNTGLGKFIAIILIISYALIHVGAGILALILVLSYYKFNGYDSWNLLSSIDFLDGIDVVYYINLDRSKERMETMEKMFQDSVFLGKPIQRIPAIDGKDPDELVFDKLVLNKKIA